MRTVITLLTISTMICTACSPGEIKKEGTIIKNFEWQADRFADLAIMRHQVPGFDNLTLKQKTLVYYLEQAALSGRDILYDQNYKYNLCIRHTLESIYNSYSGDRASDQWEQFVIYLKEIWFSNGIHHVYSTDKLKPRFTEDYFRDRLGEIPDSLLPLAQGESRTAFVEKIIPIIFDPEVDNKRVNLDPDEDIVAASANNLYVGVTQEDVDNFYQSQYDSATDKNLSFGLNSQLVKSDGKVYERVYRLGGLYSAAIERIVYWLEKAASVAENQQQETSILKLVEYYKTGNLATFDQYNIEWVRDTASTVDFVNGFIEVYGDPTGRKGSWEALVNIKNHAATQRMDILSKNAQWFEDKSPIDSKYKKKKVVGIVTKVIDVTSRGGDCYPVTPIGINLPNSSYLRKEYGSKSVTIENISYAYDKASSKSGVIEEFAFDNNEVARAKQYGFIAGCLHTDLHECLGHGSGQVSPGVKNESLKNYYSTIEEARADLFALYYMMSPKMQRLNLLPSVEAAKTEYDGYIRNGMMLQLKRIMPGKNIEESHMRNRQLISQWVFEKGQKENVIEKVVKEGRTYFVIRNYKKLRTLFGMLLKEVQRIRSEGDFNAARDLVERYGVKVDQVLHAEVLNRYQKLDLPSYRGFLNPEYMPVYDKDSNIVDVQISYPDNYVGQQLKYSREYSFLPVNN